MKDRLIAVISVLLLGTVPAFAESLVHDGKNRTYSIDDQRTGTQAAPALFILHGGGVGGGDQIRGGQSATLPRGWVYIFPDALDKIWSDGRTSAQGAPLSPNDDVGFLAALAEKLIAAGVIDRNRVHFAGISNGGMMSIRMACDRADLVAGIGVVAAAMQTPFQCRPSRPVKTLFIHGGDDRYVAFDGGAVENGGGGRNRKDRGAVLSIPQSVSFWRSHNRCSGDAPPSPVPDAAADGTKSVVTYAQGCAAPVGLIQVEGGGHTWPGSNDGRIQERLVGVTSRDFNATVALTSFFEDGSAEFTAPANSERRRFRRRRGG